MFAVLLFSLVVFTAGAARCPLGFVNLGRSCYLFASTTVDFAGANSFCQFFGSRLVTISSSHEDHLIRSYLLRHGKGATYYIGGTDLRGEGIFTWERPHGKKLGYTGWKHGEPNNAKGHEHCMSMPASFHYRWNDVPCSRRYRFICERAH
ncbi:perlucin-like isoform X2 [Haliotis asinina]|uniref:perlucin-like isoform X2 n=1 Tax=Haliotis asinina TaxID=109174 RepID=UPI003531C898